MTDRENVERSSDGPSDSRHSPYMAPRPKETGAETSHSLTTDSHREMIDDAQPRGGDLVGGRHVGTDHSPHFETGSDSPFLARPDQKRSDWSTALERRTDNHQGEQGANEVRRPDVSHGYTYTHDCGLAASAQALSDSQSLAISEGLVVNYADRRAREGRIEMPHPGDGSPQGAWGGTTMESRAQLFDLLPGHEIEHQTFGGLDHRGTPPTTEDLARFVESGDSVIAAVGTGDMWQGCTTQAGATDHAVFVTGVERDGTGTLTGFIINDTGLPGAEGAGVRHSEAIVQRAWADRGGKLNIIKKKAHDGT